MDRAVAMARFEDIAPIELRRLAELEKVAAVHGPGTEPAVLIEIQDLRHKYGLAPGQRTLDARRRSDLEYDFLMNTVAAALQRLTAIEGRMGADEAGRTRRQRILDIWLGALSALVLAHLVLTIVQVWR